MHQTVETYLMAKPEPVPPGYHVKLAGHHWLRLEGEYGQTVVKQWNPGAKKWSHSGNVGTEMYVDMHGYEYVCLCPMPDTKGHIEILNTLGTDMT
jgi:hypothetical protein